MNPYDDLIATAEAAYAVGRYKDAHITYGKAVAVGGARNHYCRQMRGVCSRLVAEERLTKAVQQPELRRAFLDQSARWLAKSEANLDSAFDESPDDVLGVIRLEQARTEELIARFMELCGGGGDPERRRSNARAFRAEGAERLARV